MKDSRRFAAALIGFLVLAHVAPRAQAATILSSFDNTQNFTSTNHLLTGPAGNASTLVTQDVGHSPAFGPWQMFLTNAATDSMAVPPHSISSGVDVGVTKTLTNLGVLAWTQWTEKVLSRTTIATTNDSPGFQFRNNTLLVEANYGSGFMVLTPGTHYNAVQTPAPGIGFDPNGSESIAITFLPGFAVETGDKLRISNRIFEVFGDTSVWVQGESAVIGQYPSVPEPATTLLGLAATAILRRRR